MAALSRFALVAILAGDCFGQGFWHFLFSFGPFRRGFVFVHLLVFDNVIHLGDEFPVFVLFYGAFHFEDNLLSGLAILELFGALLAGHVEVQHVALHFSLVIHACYATTLSLILQENMTEQVEVWSPRVSQKQADVLNARERFLLLHGPRYSGKTAAALHKIAKHLWDVNGARVGMFAKTVKSASIAGSYKDLTQWVLPQWIDAGFGMRFTTDPKTDAATRTHHFRVSNAWGTQSECYLFSCEHEQEVEEKVKNLRFSMIYFIELSNFKDRVVFDSTIAQLRMPNIPFDQHQWIGDTNPAEEGEDSWIWKLWLDKENPDNYSNSPLEQGEISDFKANLREIQILPEHNPFLDPRDFATLKASLGHSKNLTDRYIHGKWVADASTGLLADVFNEEVHVIGNTSGAKDEWEQIVPSERCMELISGWDPGDSWHSVHMIEKIRTDTLPIYCVLDELYNEERHVSLKMLSEAAVTKMEDLENYVAGKYKRSISWRHWCDAAAINNYKAAADSYDAGVVYAASKGKIRLIGAPKGAGAVKRRVSILRTLMIEKRIFFSANCKMTIEMVRKLKKGSSELHYVARNKYKHIFDSLTYILDAEEPMEQVASFSARTDSKIILA